MPHIRRSSDSVPAVDESKVPPADLQVIPFSKWCASKGISYSTGRRLVAEGKGPRITHMSDRLLGVQVRHDREWLDGRTSKK
jgi:hypothetical protein